MGLEWVIALVSFTFVMAISPGPSNFLLLASGANFGFGRTLPLLLGVAAGLLSLVFVVGAGLGSVLERIPVFHTVLRVVSSAYIFWLALQIAKSRTMGSTTTETVGAPITFLQGVMVQLLNPKAWVVALIVAVSYVVPEQFLISLGSILILFTMVILPSFSVWVVSGAALRRTLSKGRRIIVFNIAMALLLVGSMIPVLLSVG